jgi:hypothetical protein
MAIFEDISIARAATAPSTVAYESPQACENASSEGQEFCKSARSVSCLSVDDMFTWWRVSFAAATMTAVAGCQGATGVMLEVTTDIPCEGAKTVTTAIRGGLPADYRTTAPLAVTTRCDSAGKIGTLVLVPSGDESAALAIEVTTALASKDPSTCRTDARGCVSVRRVLHYVPHQVLYVPVVVEAACVGVVCGEGQTCEAGRCASVSNVVDGGADDGSVARDAGAGSDAAPRPPPTTCPEDTNPGGAFCCGTTWCVGADCASLCGSCEMLHCASGVCAENGGQKVKCAPPP